MADINASADVSLSPVLAIIPARGGSKGIPGKNLRRVGGLSLLARCIRTTRNSDCVDRIVVSTDDDDIAAEARRHSAEVIMRPAEISTDTASSEAALLHVLEHLQRTEDYHPKVTVFLQCTAPLTTAADIDGTVGMLREADAAFAAAASHLFLWREDPETGWRGINHSSTHRGMRQDLPREMAEAGSVFAMRTDRFLAARNRFCGKLAIWGIPAGRLLDVDEPEDLERARQRIAAAGLAVLPAVPAAVVCDFDRVMTDDRVWVSDRGEEAVACSRADGMGIEFLKQAGVRVLILSKERNSVVSAQAQKLAVDVIEAGDDKEAALRDWCAAQGIPPAEIAYLGNDVNDLGCFAAVGIGVAVADAQPAVAAAADIVLDRRSGQGAVREFADMVMKALESRDAKSNQDR